ncbi:hypothetical protein [Actinoplanes sp. NPDC049681]
MLSLVTDRARAAGAARCGTGEPTRGRPVRPESAPLIERIAALEASPP